MVCGRNNPRQHAAEGQPVGGEAEQPQLQRPPKLARILGTAAEIGDEVVPPVRQPAHRVAQHHLGQPNGVRRFLPTAPVSATVDSQPAIFGLLIVERLACLDEVDRHLRGHRQQEAEGEGERRRPAACRQ